MAGAAMVARTAEGFEVDARLLAEAFRLPPAEIQALMREGKITSRCEMGTGNDAGRWRLSFRHAGRLCRITVDAEGRVLGRATLPDPAGS